ncbi:alpha/beta hydrolase [Variovorax saccharolyticus]|uniref:alpha/beta hydrolase n=1 Tax=Variovorax saccharolyticus TaxID=3053516 RepID=UPI0025759A22|nr:MULTISPECIES: dienelactone hydrolase family protein [unclassified Variovorax]MDM0022394.1 dienelactone hydrolase family protein [Variovorax sp. J22R187]MDM0029050.1 dienelactone hydrolase family protein [Variovorax sp. J31P216]
MSTPREPEYPKLVMPDTVERTRVKIWSNGIALDADLYRPKDLGGDRRAPAVVLSHGWGGSKSTGERYAAKFAEAGIVSLCFTYSGWAASGSHVLLVGDRPDLEESNEVVAKVRLVREVVDPVEWLQNYRSAVDFIEGEPNVDPDRIGAWGTSFGGGIAMHHTANDDRIKVLAIQVASLSSVLKGPLAAHARQRAVDIARGRIAPVPQGIDAYPGLAGTPHLARFLQYNTIDEVSKLKVPTLMMDAGNEELFDIRENSGKAYDILKSEGTVPVHYKVIDGIDHYGIYFSGFDEGSEAALEWFSKHL